MNDLRHTLSTIITPVYTLFNCKHMMYDDRHFKDEFIWWLSQFYVAKIRNRIKFVLKDPYVTHLPDAG